MNAKPDSMADLRLARLGRCVRIVDALLHRGASRDDLDRLVADEGAVHDFRGGTYVLRLAGVTGSCTAGGTGLLTSWLRAARKCLAELEARR